MTRPSCRPPPRTVVSEFENYVKLNKKVPPEVVVSINKIEEPAKLADTISAHLALKVAEKQQLLELNSVSKRLERILGLMEGEIGVLQVEKKIRNRVKRQMEKTQREYYLNEQMKAIQKELGETEDGRDEISELEKRIKKTRLSKEAREKANAELKKLRTMSPMSAEATVVRNYLDWLLSIPWRKPTKIIKDLKYAEDILNADHHGLEKVKERILEYLAVQQRVDKMKGPILCLVGPPGVGKTSLGKSIAKATGRNFVRMSLGGVRDEAEIRGHRRTYIGSLPGKVIQSMKKAKSSNPLFLLDEIDKLGADFRGDPSSALLEVLDPEQNSTFNDHYLEVDYDLSNVMFITTANSLRMAQPLMDRMEIIRLAGYTEDEKVAIARKHLIPKQVEANGLKEGELDIADDAVRDLVRYYTREAGVRNLEREIANLARKATKEILMKGSAKVKVRAKNLDKYAGVRRFRYGEAELEDLVGITTGPGLDRGRRRAPAGRGRAGARPRPHERHRQAGRRDAGVGAGGQRLCPLARQLVRHQAGAVREARHPHPRARGRDAQGRTVGRRGDDHLDRLGADRRGGAQGSRHDRRDQPARPGPADRRPEGEAAGGVARRAQDRAHSQGERARSAGDSRQREEGPGDRPGLDGRRGAGPRAGQAAGRHRMAERPRRPCRPSRPRGPRSAPTERGFSGLTARSPGAIRGFVAFGPNYADFGPAAPTKCGIRR